MQQHSRKTASRVPKKEGEKPTAAPLERPDWKTKTEIPEPAKDPVRQVEQATTPVNSNVT
jgi:hypothetical protein